MRAGETVAVLIITDDPSGKPVEVFFDSAVIEEITVSPFGRIREFSIQPYGHGELIYTPYAPRHRKPKHAKETP